MPTMKAGGIYIEIRGDQKQLRSDLDRSKKLVSSAATEMSNAMGNALSSNKISRDTNKLVRNLNSLANTSKVVGVEFDDIALDAKKMGVQLGVSDTRFAELQNRMLKTSVARTQERALLGIARAADLTSKETRELGRQMGLTSKQIKTVTKRSRHATQAVQLFGKSIRGAIAYMATDRLVDFGLGLSRMMDNFTELENRLNLVVDSHRQLNSVMNETYDIAADSRVAWSASSDLYFRFARSARALGYSQRDLAQVTETVSKAVAISGSSAGSASAALFQMGQGIAANALRGQELNSIMEQTPRVARAIAEGLGIEYGQLRKVAEQGKLTATAVIDALKAQSDVVNEEFEKTNKRMSQGWTRLSDSALRFFGVLDDNAGLSDTVVGRFSDAAEAVDLLTDSLNEYSEEVNAVADKSIDFGFGPWSQLFRILRKAPDEAKQSSDEVESEIERRNRTIARLEREIDRTLDQIAAEGEDKHRERVDKEIERFEKKHKKEAEIAAKANADVADRLFALTHTRVEQEIREIERVARKDMERGADAVKVEQWRAAAIAEIRKREAEKAVLGMDDHPFDARKQAEDTVFADTIAKQKQALADFHTEYVRATQGETALAEEAARAQAEAWKKAGADRVQVETWLSAQINEAHEARKQSYADLMGTLSSYGSAFANEEAQRVLKRVEEEKKAQRTMVRGAHSAFHDYAASASDAFANAQEAVNNSMSSMEDALVQLCSTGKMQFSDLAQSIMADLSRIMIRQSITAPLAGAMSGFTAGLFHSGGVVGSGGGSRAVPPAAFVGAPRYHSGGIAGLAPDEVPAILRRREEVLTEDDPRHRDNLTTGGGGARQLEVHIHNESGEPMRVKRATVQDDPARQVMNLWIEGASRNIGGVGERLGMV